MTSRFRSTCRYLYVLYSRNGTNKMLANKLKKKVKRALTLLDLTSLASRIDKARFWTFLISCLMTCVLCLSSWDPIIVGPSLSMSIAICSVWKFLMPLLLFEGELDLFWNIANVLEFDWNLFCGVKPSELRNVIFYERFGLVNFLSITWGFLWFIQMRSENNNIF